MSEVESTKKLMSDIAIKMDTILKTFDGINTRLEILETSNKDILNKLNTQDLKEKSNDSVSSIADEVKKVMTGDLTEILKRINELNNIVLLAGQKNTEVATSLGDTINDGKNNIITKPPTVNKKRNITAQMVKDAMFNKTYPQFENEILGGKEKHEATSFYDTLIKEFGIPELSVKNASSSTYGTTPRAQKQNGNLSSKDWFNKYITNLWGSLETQLKNTVKDKIVV